VIAVDTNVLVHAHRGGSPFHEPARRVVRELAEGAGRWAVPWPCLHEFLAVVTHPRVFDPPSTVAQALGQVAAWTESPSLVVLPEGADHWERLQGLVQRARVVGPRVHDARVAAICLSHGVSELLTADRDFGSFPELRVRNPLVGPASPGV